MAGKQKISICCLLLLLVSMGTCSNHRSNQRASMLRQLHDLLEEEKDSLADRRAFDEDKEQYMILRATSSSNNTGAGIKITLQNRAVMNTRLRVLYTSADGSPAIAETGRLWAGQTKFVVLPVGAKNIKITVEKDIFFESWRVAYQGTITKGNECIRIVGVTLSSKIHSCN